MCPLRTWFKISRTWVFNRDTISRNGIENFNLSNLSNFFLIKKIFLQFFESFKSLIANDFDHKSERRYFPKYSFPWSCLLNLIKLQVSSDGFMLYPAYQTLKYQSKAMNSSTYFYLFNYEGTFSYFFTLGYETRYGKYFQIRPIRRKE